MSEQLTFEQVRLLTQEFFDAHWNLDEPPPSWDPEHTWRFKNPMPGRKFPGCYALLADGHVVYVGVATSDPGGRYSGHGLGARISHHYQRDPDAGPNHYKPLSKWREKGVDEVRLIPFPRKHGYLALALEGYLISRLDPPPHGNLRNPARHSEPK